MKTTWKKVMEMKKNDFRCNGVMNNLDTDEIHTIVATIDYFGGNVKQAHFDLKLARFRVFDWLAMGVMGGRIGSESATKVMVYSFLKADGNIDNFVDDLRATDYEMITDWEKLKLTS